jgi:hypothetical protein
MSEERREGGGITRLSFIKTGAVAAAGVGAAAIVPAAAAAAVEQKGVETEPSGPNPPEPVMAYVRDERQGEVTVMRGTSERTYRDRALVKRLLAAAPAAAAKDGE